MLNLLITIFNNYPIVFLMATLGLLLVLVWVGRRTFFKKKKTNQKLDKRTLAGKAYDLAKTRMLPLMKKQRVEFGFYSGFRNDDDLIARAYSTALHFSEPPALAKEFGLSVDKTNSREFYLDLYGHQLQDIVPIDEAKVVIGTGISRENAVQGAWGEIVTSVTGLILVMFYINTAETENLGGFIHNAYGIHGVVQNVVKVDTNLLGIDVYVNREYVHELSTLLDLGTVKVVRVFSTSDRVDEITLVTELISNYLLGGE